MFLNSAPLLPPHQITAYDNNVLRGLCKWSHECSHWKSRPVLNKLLTIAGRLAMAMPQGELLLHVIQALCKLGGSVTIYFAVSDLPPWATLFPPTYVGHGEERTNMPLYLHIVRNHDVVELDQVTQYEVEVADDPTVAVRVEPMARIPVDDNPDHISGAVTKSPPPDFTKPLPRF